MPTINRRLANLEAQHAPKQEPRIVVLQDGIYTERGHVISAAEYQAIAEDPRYDITLVKIVYETNFNQENIRQWQQ